jgi:photosystem II stability/assembly factor-like uncharacterized protein
VKQRLAQALIGGALVWLVPSASLANGRFPLANQLVVDPVNSKHMVARATFGILESDDDGATWTWICEDAVGYFGVEDPAIAVTANGSTLVASSMGLAVSHDGGCSWTKRMVGADRRSGVDVTVNPVNPHEALALESLYTGGVYSVSLLKTSDDGDTWTEVGPLPVNVLAETVEIAPSNPDRVYVSARINPSQVSALLRSDDGGLTWTQNVMDLPTGASAYIGAVDPQNPDVVYVRAQVPANTLGRVHITRDAGVTWTQIWRGQGDVAGFALSADGATVALGGPESGINVASTSNLMFTSPNPLGPSCLTWSKGKLFACAKEAVDFFSIGTSDDKGVSFVPLLHFPDITPRACGAATSAAVCAATWSSVASTIGADAGPVADASLDGPVALPPPDTRTKKVEAAGGWNCAFSEAGRTRGSAWALVLAALFGAWRARSAKGARTKRRGSASCP